MIGLAQSSVALEVTVVNGIISDDGGIQPIKTSVNFFTLLEKVY